MLRLLLYRVPWPSVQTSCSPCLDSRQARICQLNVPEAWPTHEKLEELEVRKVRIRLLPSLHISMPIPNATLGLDLELQAPKTFEKGLHARTS